MPDPTNPQQPYQQPVQSYPSPNQQAGQQGYQQAGQQSYQQTAQQTYQQAAPQQSYQQAAPQQPAGYQSYQQPAQQNYTAAPYQPQNGNETLTVGHWVLTILITCIPIVNIIMMFVWGFGSSTPSAKKNWALAQLIWMAIAIVLSIILTVTGAFAISDLANLN